MNSPLAAWHWGPQLKCLNLVFLINARLQGCRHKNLGFFPLIYVFLLVLLADSDIGMATVNRCLAAAKACNVDDLCQKLRTEYVSACIKPTPKSGLCNQGKCNKALRRFFDRVPADYTHELLFCPCTDTACAERRRQTIVPSCSYETAEKPSCFTQMRICNADLVCRLVCRNVIHFIYFNAIMSGLDIKAIYHKTEL